VNCRRADLDKKPPAELHRNYFICGKHFERSQFYNGLQNRLVSDAVPTLFQVSMLLPRDTMRVCILRFCHEISLSVYLAVRPSVWDKGGL